MMNGLPELAGLDWPRGQRALSELSRRRSHVLTRAVADNLFVAARPDWTPGQSALVRLSGALSGALMRAIAGKLLDVRGLSNWSECRRAVASVFGLDLSHHLFHAAPVKWVWMTEPQATRAFADFLNAEGPTVRSGRIQAFLRALGSGPRQSDVVFEEPSAEAEASAGDQRRIDLLLSWRDAAGLARGAVVEAKFGHHLTKGQLKEYQKFLLGRESRFRKSRLAADERPLLFVVSSRRRAHDDRELARNRDWRWISWRSLLLAFDRTLVSDHDDEDFRQFRRTLWDRAGS